MRPAALIAILLAAGACSKSSAPSDEESGSGAPVAVECVAAARSEVIDRVVVRGTLRPPPDKDASVSPAVAGRIVTVRVAEGDRVSAGDLVAVIDDPSLASASAEAGAAVQSAEAAALKAKQALDRAGRLFKEGIAAGRDVEEARAREAAARADLAAARSQKALAAKKQARARVKAPIAGTVVKVFRRAGELVDGTPATPVVEIADAAALELAGDVPSADLVKLAKGDRAEVELDALPSNPLHGEVAWISPAVDSATSLGGVRVRLAPTDEQKAKLHIGLAGEARLKTGAHFGLVVPASALRRAADGKDEVVACKRGEGGVVAEVRPVQVGVRSAKSVEITTGLAAGDEVVATHALGLEDGAKLATSSGGAPATPAPKEAPK